MNRREFLKTSAILAAGTATAPLWWTGCAAAEPPRPIVAFAQNTGLIRNDQIDLDSKVVREMLDACVCRVTGQADAKQAWQSLFRTDDVVGIKVNTLAGGTFCSHVQLVQAIAEGLRSVGVPAKNIIVWDRFSRELADCGFNPGATDGPYRCIGTDGRYSTNLDDITTQGVIGSFMSPIISRLCTAQINVPMLKDHDLAGVTLGLKNWFGAIHNPSKYHFGNLHDAISDVNAIPAIRKQTRLTVCDATRVVYEGGPGFKPQFMERLGGILVGRDPVAIDAVGWAKIEEMRKAHNMKSLKDADREPAAIALAQQKGLGVADTSKIEVAQV
ncbi:MAG TPA: DUF362 domain-containing protein [Planctomycetota bacterium]|nr:DUF362 domain-containing protein [Planctomycetota bacterium]